MENQAAPDQALPRVGSAPMVRPLSLVTRAQLQALRKRPAWRGLAMAVEAWGWIVLAVAIFAIWPNPVTFVLAVAIVGSRQLGLLYLMHEGAHGLLAETDVTNLRISQWLCAYPMLVDTLDYRRTHLLHHLTTLQPDDPDLHQTAGYPVTRAGLVRTLLLDGSGVTTVRERTKQVRDAWGGNELTLAQHVARFQGKLGRGLLVNAILFILCAAAGHWGFYFLFWLLPVLTWNRFARTILTLSSHAVVSGPNDPYRHARTTMAGPLTRFFFYPYGSNYHLDHHLIAYVPCYRMPQLHRLLMAGPAADKLEIVHGLFATLRIVASKDAGLASPGAGV